MHKYEHQLLPPPIEASKNVVDRDDLQECTDLVSLQPSCDFSSHPHSSSFSFSSSSSSSLVQLD